MYSKTFIPQDQDLLIQNPWMGFGELGTHPFPGSACQIVCVFVRPSIRLVENIHIFISDYVSSFYLISLTTELSKLNDLLHVVSRVGEQNTTAKMLLAPPAGLRSTCMALSSGWIKFSLRWVHLTILFHLCLKRPQASASWKLLSLACTWRMDESDTIDNWQRSLDNTWPLWPIVGFRNLKNTPTKHLGNILLISRICFVYIVTFCCKNHLKCILLAGLCV